MARCVKGAWRFDWRLDAEAAVAWLHRCGHSSLTMGSHCGRSQTPTRVA
jgi:hypothetical protein